MLEGSQPYRHSVHQRVPGGGQGRHGGHGVVGQGSSTAGGRSLLPLLLRGVLVLLQQGGEVQAGALQLAVGPPRHHVTLVGAAQRRRQTEKNMHAYKNPLRGNNICIVCAVVLLLQYIFSGYMVDLFSLLQTFVPGRLFVCLVVWLFVCYRSP